LKIEVVENKMKLFRDELKGIVELQDSAVLWNFMGKPVGLKGMKVLLVETF
jgi:hypothetical protein